MTKNMLQCQAHISAAWHFFFLFFVFCFRGISNQCGREIMSFDKYEMSFGSFHLVTSFLPLKCKWQNKQMNLMMSPQFICGSVFDFFYYHSDKNDIDSDGSGRNRMTERVRAKEPREKTTPAL